MSSKSAERPRELDIPCNQPVALPIKLYLYGNLLFELFNGGKTRRKVETACAKVDSRLYRSDNCLFEVDEGSHKRFDLEIEWERLGFPVDEATLKQPRVPTPQPSTQHQKRPRIADQQCTQLPLWPTPSW